MASYLSIIIDEVCVNPVTWDLWPDGVVNIYDMVVALRNTADSGTSLGGIVLETGQSKVFYSGTIGENGTRRFYNRIDSGVVLDELPLTIKVWNKAETPWLLLDEFHYTASAPNACWQRQPNDTWVQKAGPRSAGF